MSTEQIVRQYGNAQVERNLDAMRLLAHPDIVVTYPQSGEVMRGIENYLDMLANYPGGIGQIDSEFAVHGSKEHVSVLSSPFGLPTITVTGSGDTFFVEARIEYTNGEVFNAVGLIQLRDDKVATETWYFASPFDAPEWRTPYVE